MKKKDLDLETFLQMVDAVKSVSYGITKGLENKQTIVRTFSIDERTIKSVLSQELVSDASITTGVLQVKLRPNLEIVEWGTMLVNTVPYSAGVWATDHIKSDLYMLKKEQVNKIVKKYLGNDITFDLIYQFGTAKKLLDEAEELAVTVHDNKNEDLVSFKELRSLTAINVEMGRWRDNYRLHGSVSFVKKMNFVLKELNKFIEAMEYKKKKWGWGKKGKNTAT